MKIFAFILLICINSSMSAQSFWLGNLDYKQPTSVQELAVSPDGVVFAGSGSAVFTLDSSHVWANWSRGITASSGYAVNAFGFSKSALFTSLNGPKLLYRSLNGGRTWQLSVTGLGVPIVKKIVTVRDTILAMTTIGFFRSTNDGDNWALANIGLKTANSNNDLVRLENGTLLLATNHGMFRSTDNAAQWTGIASFTGLNCQAFGTYPNGDIVAAADTSLYLSKDNGDTWNIIDGINWWWPNINKIVYADSTLFFLCSSTVFSYKNNELNAVYQGNSTSEVNIAAAPDGTLYLSDYTGVNIWNAVGKKFEKPHTGFGYPSYRFVASDAVNEYVGIEGRGVYYSVDNGVGWNLFLADAKYPKGLSFIGSDIYVCDSTSLFKTSDQGTTWTVLHPVMGTGAYSIARAGGKLFAGVPDHGVFVSSDNGSTWEEKNSTIGAQSVPALLSLKDSSVLAGTPSGIFITTDAGSSWTRTGNAENITTLFLCYNGTILAGSTNGIYRSLDGGLTWERRNVLTGTVATISSTAISFVLLASTSDGIYISTDDGASWNKNASDILCSITERDGRIFAVSSSELKFGYVEYKFSSTTKWLTAGSLQNWYAEIGAEPGEYRSTHETDGWCYPSIRPYQDMQVSKAVWIGYDDPSAAGKGKKAVSMIGPHYTDDYHVVPFQFALTNKIEPPTVNLRMFGLPNRSGEPDYIDGAQKSDLLLENAVSTSSGIVMRRKVRQFSQQFHDNYIILENTYVNTSPNRMTGIYFYHLYRWGINSGVSASLGDPIGYGKNTMIDTRGDGQNPAATFFPGNKDNDIRAIYAWHGKYPAFTGGYDNIGGPMWPPTLLDPADTVGRLGAPQFVGVAVLHADKSSHDTTDDAAQPATMSYEDSDGKTLLPYPVNDSTKDANTYALISKGRSAKRHADLVGPEGDPSLGTSGGMSGALGFGPYTLEPGDSVRIVLVEAAAGIDDETALAVGRQFKAGTITAQQKNAVVYTGRDSLFQTFRRAIANYQSGYAIPQPPLPPKTFSVNVIGNSVSLEWTTYAEPDPRLAGFDIYRATDTYYSHYEKIHSSAAGDRAWTDSTCQAGTKYFYYIVSVGHEADNTGCGGTPLGALHSNRYYTQSIAPKSVATAVASESGVPAEFSLGQNYPNPFNPSTTFSFSLPERSHVSLNVFDALGRNVAVLLNDTFPAGKYSHYWNATGLASGMYFYRLRAGSFTETKKLLLLR